MDNEVRFLYSVYPKKPIKGLLDRPINSPKSLSLTKEEVLFCMKCGSVYRRFDDRNEKITTLNIDRLHNKTFITENEWNKMIAEKKAARNQEPEKVEEPKVEEPKIEEPKTEEPVVEQPVEEAQEEVETTEEKEKVVELVDNNEVEDSAEVEEDTEVEETETDNRGTVVNTEAEIPDQIVPASGYINYNHKKKRKH